MRTHPTPTRSLVSRLAACNAADPQYQGIAAPGGACVLVDHIARNRPLPNRGAAAFAWGEAGDGAEALARSILAHATGDPNLADALAGRFKWRFLVPTPADECWTLSRSMVLRWAVGTIEQQR